MGDYVKDLSVDLATFVKEFCSQHEHMTPDSYNFWCCLTRYLDKNKMLLVKPTDIFHEP